MAIRKNIPHLHSLPIDQALEFVRIIGKRITWFPSQGEHDLDGSEWFPQSGQWSLSSRDFIVTEKIDGLSLSFGRTIGKDGAVIPFVQTARSPMIFYPEDFKGERAAMYASIFRDLEEMGMFKAVPVGFRIDAEVLYKPYAEMVAEDHLKFVTVEYPPYRFPHPFGAIYPRRCVAIGNEENELDWRGCHFPRTPVTCVYDSEIGGSSFRISEFSERIKEIAEWGDRQLRVIKSRKKADAEEREALRSELSSLMLEIETKIASFLRADTEGLVYQSRSNPELRFKIITKWFRDNVARKCDLVIGRFQPFHNGHLRCVAHATNPVIVVVHSGKITDESPFPLDVTLRNIHHVTKAKVIVVENGFLPNIVDKVYEEFGVGVKRIVAGEDRADTYRKQIKREGLDIEVVQLERVEGTPSGTSIRQQIRDGKEPRGLHPFIDVEELKRYIEKAAQL